ncbi:MAG: chemotaxis protein CheV [Gammaproteobacteria bacterium]|nr:chemotaxis protein CheV [Gammaproteobacteria bacterium]
MSGVLDNVDLRTQLVGENRLELLMFKLKGRQLFALNVFKVQEVLRLPPMTIMPQSHPAIRGVIHLRGTTIPVIDLSQSIGLIPNEASPEMNLIITEYNNSIQGFMVNEVDRIINLNWDRIMPPPKGTGRSHYLTAITRLDDDQLIEIVDVEKVLAEVIPYDISLTEGVIDDELMAHLQGKRVLHADDSSTARLQVSQTLEQIGVEVIPAENGQQALDILKGWCDEGKDVSKEIMMLITDAEMPQMDGYRLTFEVRQDPRMRDLYVTLNTSLSGVFNKAMVEKVGCNKFVSKFQPDLLVETLQERMREMLAEES